MAKGLLATQEAEYRRLAALRSAEASYREKQALREAAFAKEARAAAELPAGSFAYEQLSDGIPPVQNFAPPPVQNLIQQPQHIGGRTTSFIGGPPPIDKRMTFTKPFPQQVGADSYEHRMGVTQQPGLLVDQSNNAGLVGRPQPMPQPTLSDLPSGITQTDIQRMLNYDRRGKQQMTALPDNSGFRPGQQPTLLNQQQMPGARLPRSLVQSSAAQLIGATPPTLSGKTIQPLSEYASMEPGQQAVSPQPVTVKSGANNAFGVEYQPSNTWDGQVRRSDEGRFDSFTHPKYSARASAIIRLKHYLKDGIKTPLGLVEKYTPRDEKVGDVFTNRDAFDAYVAEVVRETGSKNKNAKVDLTDKKQLMGIMRATLTMEGTGVKITDSDLEWGVDQALKHFKTTKAKKIATKPAKDLGLASSFNSEPMTIEQKLEQNAENTNTNKTP